MKEKGKKKRITPKEAREMFAYKKAYEQQKRLTIEAIATAEKWKELCDDVSKKYDQVIRKDLKDASDTIQRLQKKNNELILEVAMCRSRYEVNQRL